MVKRLISVLADVRPDVLGGLGLGRRTFREQGHPEKVLRDPGDRPQDGPVVRRRTKRRRQRAGRQRHPPAAEDCGQDQDGELPLRERDHGATQ
ncbi:MAG: hypothetical protein ACK559_23345 [bacterium]